MRKIKFRGMWDGKWDHATPNDSHWEQFWAASDRETIGQYSGLHDKNGKEIYEGDIAKNGFGDVAPVVFDRGGFIVKWTTNVLNKYLYFWSNNKAHVFEVEIIGNIYENPDLLK